MNPKIQFRSHYVDTPKLLCLIYLLNTGYSADTQTVAPDHGADDIQADAPGHDGAHTTTPPGCSADGVQAVAPSAVPGQDINITNKRKK